MFALFWGIWFALMRFAGIPITWIGVSAIASISVFAFALQRRMWWLAFPAAVAALVLFQRETRRREH